jgi:hypothetical protein
MENFKSTRQYYELKGIFTNQLLSSIENDTQKINFFYENVLPSIATQVALFGENVKKWVCTLKECNQASFESKNDYIRHVIEIHGSELPGKGEFLINNRLLTFYENNSETHNISNLTKALSLNDNVRSCIVRSCSLNPLDESFSTQDLNSSMLAQFGSFENIKDSDVSNRILDETQLIRIEEQEEEDFWQEYFANLHEDHKD